MDYQVSARKYRPGTFEEVVGQEHVVQTLMNAIASQRVAHALLFSGTRGVGKTTVARIVAKALNCESGMTGIPCNTCSNCTDITQGASVDVIEIDGASNTSVEDVREVRENVKFAPFRGRYRVYIIDEVHMLSNSAFNALLKTLEEPPGHVVFVFATTEIHKIPATILSRCQHYNFRKISRTEIVRQLGRVVDQENLDIEEPSLNAIAKASEGSMRDALSLLDQAVAFGGKKVNHKDLEALLGAVPQKLVQEMIDAILSQDSLKAIRLVAALQDQGHDLRTYCSDIVEGLRNLLVAKVVSSPEELQTVLECSVDEQRQIHSNTQRLTVEHLQDIFRIFSNTADGLRVSAHPRFLFEIAAIGATRITGEKEHIPAQATSLEASHVTAPVPHSTSKTSSGRSAKPLNQEKSVTPSPVSEKETVLKSRVPVQGDSEKKQANPPSGTEMSSSPSPPGNPPVPPSVAQQSHLRPGAWIAKWERVVADLGNTHPRIAPFLERGVALSYDNGLLLLGFPKTESSARGMIEKEDNLAVIRDLCSQNMGCPVRVRVTEVQEDQVVAPSPAQVRAVKARENKVALLEETRSHPLVKQVLEVFGGDVVEVRKGVPQREGPE